MAAFVMAGPLQATGFVVVFALLSLFLPLLGLFSNAAIGLVALRTGWKNGISIMLYASLIFAGLGFLLNGEGFAAFAATFAQWLPILALAILLQQSNSWQRVLQVVATISMVGVLLFHGLVPDPVAFWKPVMQPVLELPFIKQQFPELETDKVLQTTALFFSGVMAAGLALWTIISLMIARHWQAGLYNPGGFAQELRQLSIHRFAGMAMMALITISLLSGHPLVTNLVVVGLAVFLFQGIALAHSVCHTLKLPVGWLIAFYVGLVLIPQLGILVATFGIIDSVANFRRHISKRYGSNG